MNPVYGICVIVVGMHRSGTSVVAGSLARMGVNFGERLLAAKADNPKGFYEHLDLLALDEAILRRLDSSYDDERPLPHNWHKDPAMDTYKQSIQDIVRRDFGSSSLFGFKDPRISILLPLYVDALTQIGIRPRFVVCERPVGEVAESLRERNGFSYAKSVALYRKHVDSIQSVVSNFDHCKVVMEDFVSDPRTQLERIRENLWIPLAPYESVRNEIEKFVEPGLKHHRIDDAQFMERILEDIGRLDGIVHEREIELANLAKDFAKLQHEFNRRDADARRFEGQLAVSNGRIEILQAHIARANEEHEKLSGALIEANHTIAHRDARIRGLESEVLDLQRLAVEADRLSYVVAAMERSMTWKATRFIHGIIERIAPPGTRRGDAYHSMIVGAQRALERRRVKADTAESGISLDGIEGVDILFVNHEETLTGAPRILIEIAKRAARRHSFVVASKARGGMHREFEAAFGDRLIHPGELSASRDRFTLAAETIDAVRPAAVYVNSIVSYEYAFEARKRGIPTLMHVHELGAAFDRALEPLWREKFRECADSFVAASEATRDYLVEHLGCDPEKVEVAHEFVDGNAVRSAAKRRARRDVERELGIARDEVLVVAMGTFDKRKGADLFVKAAARARKLGSQARFVWIGRAPHPSEDLGDAYKSLLEHGIHVPESADPFPYLARADVFVLPSREDPFPLVVLEAMALGKPVIAFERSGGAREALRDGAGELVADFSASRLAERIDLVLKTPVRAAVLSENAQRAQLAFDASIAHKHFDSIVDSLVEQGRAARATI